VAEQKARVDRGRLEVERGKQQLAAFNAANPELVDDDMAMSAMERRLFIHFAEDLQKVGFDTSQLQSSADLANMHMRFRANGHAVRSLGQLFEAAKQDYLQWRGDQQPKPKPPAPPSKAYG
jgi:hypothetical protein